MRLEIQKPGACTGFLDSVVGATKDIAVQVALNHLLGDIGSISRLTINRKTKHITGALLLAGENKAVDIVTDGWDWGAADNPNGVRVLGFSSSKPWLTNIAAKVVVNRWFSIPAEHLGMIRMTLG